MIDHDWIKAKAQELGRPVTDLLALARQNDPFYVGTPASRTQAQWFADIWARGGFSSGVHLRRLHYWCVSQAELMLPNGKPYVNMESCWQFLCVASKAARYLGLVAISDIADHKNPEPHVIAEVQREPNARFFVDTPELAEPRIYINEGDGYNLANVQPYHLEVWVEKSTMNDVLLPVCRRFLTNLVTGEGEMTITAVYGLLRRIRGARKPTRIFYISDFDPAGYSMPCAVARKLEYLVRTDDFDIDVRLHRLLLNREHVDAYSLPRTPIKETERRASKFEARHGEGCVELDALEALHPGVLARIVTRALSHYFSSEANEEAREKERALRRAIREQVSAITERYAKEIEALQQMNREIDQVEVDGNFEPEPPEPEADDGAYGWLFDSGREYLEQIAAYKAYVSGGDLEPGDGREHAA
jgi:hypothetical protein